jgi:DNA-binding GntR family transcriptional regulator
MRATTSRSSPCAWPEPTAVGSAHAPPSSPPPQVLISRLTLRDEVRDWLIARIYDGTFGPGERLLELKIAEEFGISQAPVREALRELAAMRLVEHVRFNGTRVAVVTVDEVLATFPVRIALELLAAKLAAPRLQAHVGALQEPLEAMRAAAADGAAAVMLAADVRFHAALVAAADNQPLLDAWEALAIGRHAPAIAADRRLDLTQVAESHVPIVEACARGDATGAAKALRAHLKGAERRMQRHARATAAGPD